VLDPEFLSREEIEEMHQKVLARWGGADGVRDEGALLSAIAQPQASYGGEYLHEDLFAMAAAYGFHIAEAQAFLDGSKRTAVLAIINFLNLNGIRLLEPKNLLNKAMENIANHTLSKEGLAELLRGLVKYIR
jgi:death on curing protein